MTIAALATAFFLSRRYGVDRDGFETPAFGSAGIAANALAVWALSLEVWEHLERVSIGLDRAFARQLGLSVVWTLCACALIVCGVRNASAALRWQGLALIGLAVGKVFLFDLSSLERGYRILSFFALGLVLLIVSFLYQRRTAGSS